MTAPAKNQKLYPAARNDLPVACPKCGKGIRKNQVDVRRFNWDAIVELGILGALLAPFFPHESVAYQCEHCGKIFPIPPADAKRGDRFMRVCGWLLILAASIYILWLIFT